jgi:RHS repeat-associated protein
MLREGEIRYSWTSNPSTTPAYKLTSYTFTGQYSYMDDPTTAGVTEGFGLMFYNARMYDPALGRFTSADTIVPGGVQGLDRYAYANNSPVMYIDPSGHVIQKALYFEGDGPLPMASYGVFFAGKWKANDMLNIAQGVRDVGTKSALVREKGESAAGAFQSGFGTDSTPLYFLHGNTSNEFWDDGSGDIEKPDGTLVPRGCEISAGGCTVGLTTRTNGQRVYLIKFVTMSSNPLSARNNVVHELGHLFGSQIAGYTAMSKAIDRYPEIFGRLSTSRNYGFASSGFPWQQATHNVDWYYEVFADQFLGWTYDTWQTSERGGLRASWMNVNMASWLTGR